MNSEGSGHGLNQDGWKRLLDGYPWFLGDGKFPLPAYSEFMPSPRLGIRPYGEIDASLFVNDDPFGWNISEIEEEYELKPGFANLARQIMKQIVELGNGQPVHYIMGHDRRNLIDNPYWPPDLAAQTGHLLHEPYIVFLPLALSKTQDDKGRMRWTFFGGSEQGPEKAFWKSFYHSPGQERPSSEAIDFLRHLFSTIYGKKCADASELYRIGFRILPSTINTCFPYWNENQLPSWTQPFLLNEDSSLDSIHYILTFRPFTLLPAIVRERYLAGQLALLPFPGSLVFWGMQAYIQLQKELPFAMQLPLQRMVARHGGLDGIKVPQSGWFHEPGSKLKQAEVIKELLLNTYKRTHRWDKIQRYEDEITMSTIEDPIGQTLFSTDLDILKLYGKPMARNCQLWDVDSHLLLDGPNAIHEDLVSAAQIVAEGGTFHYRFQFPAMRVGLYEVYWHRPLIAYWSKTGKKMELLSNRLQGYLTAYSYNTADLAAPIELWPRLQSRKPYLWALHKFKNLKEHYRHQTALNIVRLLDTYRRWGEKPLPRDLAQRILSLPEQEKINSWLVALPMKANNPEEGELLRQELERCLEPVPKDGPETKSLKEAGMNAVKSVQSLTFVFTATRAFEEAWWKDIDILANGAYINKNSADCVDDPATLARLTHHRRDLEPLGKYLLSRYRQAIASAGMEGKTICGELRFHWKTDFDFASFGGWKKNQPERTSERNLIVVIPGKNHSEAIIMADHYDTAYMEDVYEKSRGGTGARIAAAGADDNHSATATLLQAAPIFLQLSQQGLLERDIWLVHLTGEEFPSDCLGARELAQALIEQKLYLHLGNGQITDLSNTHLMGIYIMDMIGHNRDYSEDVIQIAPGRGRGSLQLAWHAHCANILWNAGTIEWNSDTSRLGMGRGRRSNDGVQIPQIAEHLKLHGEIRLIEDPRSSLFNTDGQIFSDCGIPVVLIMENYDISRTGYHDTMDTMKNIDLDYGAALASIAIETVAIAANCTDRGSGLFYSHMAK